MKNSIWFGLLVVAVFFSSCRQAREMTSYSLWDYLESVEKYPNHLPVMMPPVTKNQTVNIGFNNAFFPAFSDFEAGSSGPSFSDKHGSYNSSFPWLKMRDSNRVKAKYEFLPERAYVRVHQSWAACYVDGSYGDCNDSILYPCWVHDVRKTLFFGTYEIAFSFGPHRGFVTPEELEALLTKNEIELLKQAIGEEAITNGWDNSGVFYYAFPHSIFVRREESN